LGQQHDVSTNLCKRDLHSEHRADSGATRSLRKTHNTVKPVTISQSESLKAKTCGFLNQSLRMRSPG
jgi:hypothetical protein